MSKDRPEQLSVWLWLAVVDAVLAVPIAILAALLVGHQIELTPEGQQSDIPYLKRDIHSMFIGAAVGVPLAVGFIWTTARLWHRKPGAEPPRRD